MPRQSLEAKAAATLLLGGAPPKPPKHLSAQAKKLWRSIAEAKPADWFGPGAQLLLETLCELTIHVRELSKKLALLRQAGDWDGCEEWEKRLKPLSDAQTSLCVKLRLSVQAQVDRRAGKILETGRTASSARDPLLGGRAAWSQRKAN